MSPLTQAMIVNGVVLFAVLEADLGPHRKIGRFRLLRPLLMSAAIVPMYLTALATHGTSLTLEIGGAVAGLLLGLLGTALMKVYRSERTGLAASRAGSGYAALWTIVIGARAAFSYGSIHWFHSELGSWMGRHDVTADTIANTLVVMAVTMVLTRTIAMTARVRALPTAGTGMPTVPAEVTLAATRPRRTGN